MWGHLHHHYQRTMSGKVLTFVIMTLKILLQLGTRQYHHLNLRALVISGVSGFIQVGTLLTSEDGMVGIFLQNMSNESIKVQFGFAVKNNGRISNVDFLSQKEGYDLMTLLLVEQEMLTIKNISA